MNASIQPPVGLAPASIRSATTTVSWTARSVNIVSLSIFCRISCACNGRFISLRLNWTVQSRQCKRAFTVYIHVGCSSLYLLLTYQQSFSALTLLVGRQEKHPSVRTWAIRCWHGYLFGARCKWLAYGPADATEEFLPLPFTFTATPSSLFQQNPEWFILLIPAHLDSPRQRP